MRTDTKKRRFSLISFDDMFNSIEDPIILNKIDFNYDDYSTRIQEKLYGKSADLTFVAECECGYLQGNMYENMECPECRTKATIESMGTSTGLLANSTWLSFPKEIPGVLHSRIYILLSRWLRIGSSANNRSYLDFLLDPKEPVPVDMEGVFDGSGYTYFYNNFDTIMDYFLHVHKKTSSKSVVPLIRDILRKYRHILFTHYLPILPDKLHTAVSMIPNGRPYVEKSSQFAMDAANKLSFLEFSPNTSRDKKLLDNVVHGAYKKYILYLTAGVTKMRLGQKNSLPRQHIFGTRYHWSFRSVITPLSGPHRYDEMHVPWCICVNLLKIHIVNRLIRKHDIMPHAAADRQMYAVTQYDPLIHEIINELIAESTDPRGLPVLWNRTPSLKKGSIQLIFITKVKTDLSDNTISFSVLLLEAPNADFDGDAMTGVLVLEAEMAREAETLHPARRITDTNSPHVGAAIAPPPASLLAWNKFLGQV